MRAEDEVSGLVLALDPRLDGEWCLAPAVESQRMEGGICLTLETSAAHASERIASALCVSRVAGGSADLRGSATSLR